jgi:flagellar basal-body rod protein FlgF
MNLSLFQAASGMNASMRWQEVTAENLAAGQVPGYKRQDVSFAPFAAGLVPVPTTGDTRYVMPKASSQTDFSQAGLRGTQVDTDVAIDGAGFFAVQLPSGEVGYTRDGEFRRTPDGRLLTKQGFPVMGDNGPIQLDPNNAKLFISPTGEISQGTEQRGKIRIVEFNDPSLLTPIGGGQYVSQNPGLQARDADKPSVRQGYLELGNANPVAEMTHLISSLRMFEMNQKVAQSQDERLGKTITELAGNL